MSNVEQQLEVFEYGGTARSGKGTIVAWLSEMHPEVATDETGADYRSVTLCLLNEGILEVGMNEDAITAAVQKVSLGALTDFAARRKEVENEFGTDALYAPKVGDIVGDVSPLDSVRKAVKKGFTKRVETVRDNDDHSILLVDGRNLGPVIEAISGTELVLKTFVYCHPIEAARRECLRDGLMPNTSEWDQAFEKHYDSIVKRNNKDKNRDNDPVKPDQNNIDYWKSSDLTNSTIDLYARFLFDGDKTQAMQKMFDADRDYTDIPRVGAGMKAFAQKRQIYFDTTPFASYQYPGSKHAMLLAANTMFEEAVRSQQILRGTV